MARALSAVLVAVCLLLGTSVARGDGAPLVLVVGPGDDGVVERVRSELVLMGYRVEVVERSAEWLATAGEREALGVVEVDPARHEVVLWTLDAEDPTRVASRQRVESPNAPDLALQAVELLHGRLTPVPRAASPAERPANDAPPSRTERRTRPDAPPRDTRPEGAFPRPFAVFAGPALTWLGDELPPLGSARLAVGFRPLPLVELSMVGHLPPSRATLSMDKGSAEVRVLAFGGAARVGLRLHPVSLTAGASLLAQHGSADATPSQSAFTGTRSETWSARPALELGATLAVTRDLGIGALAGLGTAAPALVVRGLDSPSDQQDPPVEARLGRAVLTASLGVEVGLGRRR